MSFFEGVIDAILIDGVPRANVLSMIAHVMSDHNGMAADEVPLINRESLAILHDDILPAWFLSTTEKRKRQVSR